MTTVREIMTAGIEYAEDTDSVVNVAQRLAVADIGAVPVCDREGLLKGIVTDRDIVVRVVARGLDTVETKAGVLADQSEVVAVALNDDVQVAVEVMKTHKVRRLPVLDGDRVVGLVSQADLAGSVPEGEFSELVAVISSRLAAPG
jgi:CBS domain-containing protein